MIVLSLTDLGRALKKGGNLLLLGTLLFGSAAFFYYVSKPINFTAKGIFNGQVTPSAAPFVKALELLGKDESTLSSTDQRSLLLSYPVLAKVVRSLNLQATLTERQMGGRLREIWYTLKSAHAHGRLKKNNPPSRILSRGVHTRSTLMIPDSHPTFSCAGVNYNQEVALSLKVVFLNEKTFLVYRGKNELGTGAINSPFVWEGGSFTLSGVGKKGEVIAIHLIPLETAVESLKNSLSVKKNKENTSLIDITYTHRDRHLAAQIVNGLMEEFQSWLAQEGKGKIQKQLLYLQQRQDETLQQLDQMLFNQKEQLVSDLSSGILVSLEQELESMARLQFEKKGELTQINTEIENLARTLHLPYSPRELRATLDELPFQALTIESARTLISQHQQQLDQMYLDNEQYEYCLAKLTESDFESSSLSKMLNDEFSHSRFEKMHTLHHRLIDAKNWGGRERELLKEELETEKRFIIQHIHHLKEGAALRGRILNERITALQQNLLSLLLDLYEQTVAALNDLNSQAAHFPQKWLNEQKIEIHTKLYTDMMESISKMVEAKNIGYNIDYLMSNTLQKATPPVIPNPPRLVAGTLLGAAAGLIVALLGICFYQVWRGPSASSDTLSSLGRIVIPKQERIPRLGFAISQKGAVALVTAQQKTSLAPPLTMWLTNRGEKVFVIDLIEQSKSEAYLASDSFKALLESHKEAYDRILIFSKNSPKSLETEILVAYADTVVYCAADERFADVEHLPSHTLFIIQDELKGLFSLKELQPKLAKLMSFSSFSLKRVWEWFPLKKT